MSELRDAPRSPIPVLEPLEIYSGLVGGPRRSPSPPNEETPAGTPREVIENILLDALSNPPCHVAFSGGRDSSAMLATAVLVARRHGLPDPIPLTLRLEEHPRTWESEWQELMMHHLQLSDGKVVPIVNELDALGKDATDALLAHGVYFPSQAHTMRLLARHAESGSLVTGGGGDELFIGFAGRKESRREIAALRPRRRAAKGLMLSLLPYRWRLERALVRTSLSFPWLRPERAEQVEKDWRARQRQVASTWGEVLEHFIDSRYMEFIRPVFDTFVSDHGVQLHEPFYDPRVIRSIIRAAPGDGYKNRTTALTTHFSDVLPDEMLNRTTKAVFTEAGWGPGARQFAASWDGSGLDEDYVVISKLREEWAKPMPNGSTLPCLQLAWLAAQRAA